MLIHYFVGFTSLAVLCSVVAALPSGFDAAHIAKCETDALRLGTNLGDIFNSPIGEEGWSERMHQNYIAKHLGFAPWLADGVQNSGGKTLTGQDAKQLREKWGWAGKNTSDSPYAVLEHKWIYMFGDSTMRQIWASLAAPFKGNNFERNAKEYTRSYCNKQQNRHQHNGGKAGNYSKEEGWAGPCGVNEVTCHISGYGDQGLLTFDWKHFAHEDYDEYVLGEKTGGPFSEKPKDETARKPDILTIQTGMHMCWHAYPEGLYSGHLKGVNRTMINQEYENLEKLMKSIRDAIDRHMIDPATKKQTDAFAPQVIIFTSGATLMGQDYGSDKSCNIDTCIKRLNRVIRDLAHKYGFAVLERGEMEQRIMYVISED